MLRRIPTAVLAVATATALTTIVAAPASSATPTDDASATTLGLDAVAQSGIDPGSSAPGPVADFAPGQIVVEGFQAPESAIWDPLTDTLLVSDYGGGTLFGNSIEKDGDGFIRRVSLDGQVLETFFIGRGNNGTLDAPKGLALSGPFLYVADIDTVKVFNRTTGEPIREIPIPGARFLNDVAVGPVGSVYVTDSGILLTPDGSDFFGTDEAEVLQIFADGSFRSLASGRELGAPNGIIVDREGRILVGDLVGDTVYELTRDGTRNDLFTVPDGGGINGVDALSDGSVIVSSNGGPAVYRFSPTGGIETLFAGALLGDISTEREENLLIPLLGDGLLVIQPLR